MVKESGIRILYAEDEESLGRIVSESLTSRKFDVLMARDGYEAVELFKSRQPQICVLDIMMPRMDGYHAAKEIRKLDTNIPIIFLTAKTQTKDVLEGFESGGNDYIRKPFSVEELIVRIHNLMQIVRGQPLKGRSEAVFKIGKYHFLPKLQELKNESEHIKLSYRESMLLEMLCHQRNDKTLRKDILMNLWGDDSYFNSRNLDVYINRLRKIFKKEAGVEIVTLKGVGYLFKTVDD